MIHIHMRMFQLLAGDFAFEVYWSHFVIPVLGGPALFLAQTDTERVYIFLIVLQRRHVFNDCPVHRVVQQGLSERSTKYTLANCNTHGCSSVSNREGRVQKKNNPRPQRKSEEIDSATQKRQEKIRRKLPGTAGDIVDAVGRASRRPRLKGDGGRRMFGVGTRFTI